MSEAVRDKVLALMQQKVRRCAIEKQLGITRGQAANTVRRLRLLGLLDGKAAPDHRTHRTKPLKPRKDSLRIVGRWTEEALTETWVERKARRAAERLAA